ncbi:MAG: response regulator [Bacteroidetes bacterium]|nr:response regulator [Bacteroidota bacterium]
MLIDDNEIANCINQKMSAGCNFADKVYVHTSGRSALEFLQNIDRNADFPRELIPQVIFLDISMPMMDGFQFVNEFEQLSPNIRNGVKIMLLTSSINPLDHQKSTTISSIVNYMNKPLTKDHLSSISVN